MSWGGPNLTFWLITILVVVSAFYATFARSILQAAFSLFFTLFGMAGYYVLLGSDFVAITQVIIYVGGILVLLVFGVLLTNRPFPSPVSLSWRAGASMCIPVVIFGVLLFSLIVSAPWTVASEELGEPVQSIAALGHLLVGKYLLPLEVAGMTLLLCLIGAAHLLRRTER